MEGPFKVPVCRLQSQVLGQEHGKDAAQVVHGGWVEVGLSVSRSVPHSREGRGDEVENWNTWRGKDSSTAATKQHPLNSQTQKIV